MHLINCFFPIEIKVRDFDSRLLTALEIVNDKHGCFVGSKTAVFNNLRNYSAPIIFDKGLSDDYFFYSDLTKIGIQTIVMGEENGLFDEKNFFPNLISQYPKDVLTVCYSSFEWGDVQSSWLSDYTKKKYNLPNFNFLSVGNPRFDLLKDKYISFFDSRKKKLKLKYGDYILINTNFTHANDLRGGRGFLFHLDKRGNDILNEYFSSIIKEYISAIKFLAIKKPKLNFVLRPHPAEGRDIYIEAFKNIKNIFVDDCKSNVHDLIISSKMIIHHDCTTAIESTLAKKPVISYMPIKSKFFEDSFIYQKLPIKISVKTKNKNELLKSIDKYLDISNYDHTINVPEIKKWIKNSGEDEYYASTFIRDYVHKNSSEIYDQYEKVKILNKKMFEKYKVTSLYNNIRKNFNYLFFFGKDNANGMGIYLRTRMIDRDFLKPLFRKFFIRKKIKSNLKINIITLEEITESINAYKRIDKKFEHVKVKKICENGFYLYKNTNNKRA